MCHCRAEQSLSLGLWRADGWTVWGVRLLASWQLVEVLSAPSCASVALQAFLPSPPGPASPRLSPGLVVPTAGHVHLPHSKPVCFSCRQCWYSPGNRFLKSW